MDVVAPDVGEPDLAPLGVEDQRQLLEQVKHIFEEEEDRREVTRKRSDELLGRILAAVSLLAAAVGVALGNPTVATLAILGSAAFVFLLALLLVLKNLGKQDYQAPLATGDLGLPGTAGAGPIRPVEVPTLVREYVRAIEMNTLWNDDAVDRRVFAHGLFILGVLVGLVGGVMTGAGWAEAKRADAQRANGVMADAGSTVRQMFGDDAGARASPRALPTTDAPAKAPGDSGSTIFGDAGAPASGALQAPDAGDSPRQRTDAGPNASRVDRPDKRGSDVWVGAVDRRDKRGG